MRIIFLKDLIPTARAGEVKDVKNGFARNYLLPNGIAVLATKHALERAEDLRKEADERRRLETESWEEMANRLAETEIKVSARAGPTGKLYGSVTQSMIAQAVSEVLKREIPRRSVRLPQPIRTAGIHPISVNLFEGVTSKIKLTVEPDVPPGGEELAKENPKQHLETTPADGSTDDTVSKGN